MSHMRRSVLLLLCFLLICAIGCDSAPKTAARPQREKQYRTVVSLSPGTTEIIASHSNSAALKGRTQACNFPPMVKAVPVVASLKPDYEKIQELSPDLIVYDADLYSESDIQKLRSNTKADFFAFDAHSIAEFEKQLYLLGSLMGTETMISQYVTAISREKGTNDQVSGTIPKVAVLMPGDAGSGDMIAGSGSFAADVVRTAGAQPVGPEATNFVKLSPEALLALNPDVILVPGSKESVKGALSVLNNPRYKSIAAVKNNRVRALNADVLLRKGGRVDKLLAGMRLAIARG